MFKLNTPINNSVSLALNDLKVQVIILCSANFRWHLSLQPSHLPLSRTQQWAPLSTQQPGCDAAAGDLCPQYRCWIAAAVIMAPQLSAHLRSEVRRILLETDWTTKPIHNLYIFRSGLQSMFRQRIAFKISVDLRIISISMLSDVHSEPRPKHAFDVGSCCEILA